MTDALSPAVFVDRDGTIMENCDYCSDPKDVKIFPGVPDALRRLKSKGFKLVIVTNQSGIGRGLITVEQYRAVEAEVLRQLGAGLIDVNRCDVFLPRRSGPALQLPQACAWNDCGGNETTPNRSHPVLSNWRQGDRRRMRSQGWRAHHPC
ncbi:MAG: hypothetical protein DME76_03105 [Verrucomicrobia bacterium]|nr:MAG: hypothetical protein DME76_03105 [Verrucomicrobiota bacterium]